MRVCILILLLFSITVTACDQRPNQTAREDKSTGVTLSANDEISYIVLFELLSRFDATKDPNKVAFVSVEKSDPTPQLLEKLRTRWPDLRPTTDSYLDEVGASVKDRLTNKDGVRYEIFEIRRIDENTVEVGGGYYSSNLGASGCDYKVHHETSNWIVAGKGDCWIS